MKIKKIIKALSVVAFLALIVCLLNEDDSMSAASKTSYLVSSADPMPSKCPLFDTDQIDVTVYFDKEALNDYIDENGFAWNAYYYSDATVPRDMDDDTFMSIIGVEGLPDGAMSSASMALSYVGPTPLPFEEGDVVDPDTEVCLFVTLNENTAKYFNINLYDFEIVAGDGVTFLAEPEVDVNAIRFVLDLGTWEELRSDDPKTEPEPEVHVHNYIWTTRDDVKKLACTGCGEVIYEYATKLVTTDQMNVEMAWNCLPSDFYEVLAGAQSDVTLHYYYRGYDITLKIPAGKLLIVDGVKWYGPEFLADLYREYAVVKTWKGPASVDDIFAK